MNEFTYNLHKPGRLIDKLATRKREEMYHIFAEEFPPNTIETVLDVGVTADSGALSSNYFEKLFPDKNKIIALSNQDASQMEKDYPGLTFKIGDALMLPFEDASIDVVVSSAVIEHVGSLLNQTKMISECHRVARKGFFITTPNRWHPVDVHTVLPFLHWLPKSIHRKMLRMLGMNFFSKEENLNLLDTRTLESICSKLGVRDIRIRTMSTIGFTSNLLLIVKK